MIFQDGELRRIESNRPMLFDGWAYVPIELNSATATAHIVLKLKPVKAEVPPASVLR